MNFAFVNKKNKWFYVIVITFIIKLILSALFSSDYQDVLFIPFVKHFAFNFDNPWQFFIIHNRPGFRPSPFPYPPFMLYILTPGVYLYSFLSSTASTLGFVFFKLPTLGADLLMLYVFIKMFPERIKEIVIFYFASPIIIYACYMHSQLDLIPTALLFFSVYLLTRKKVVISSLIFGLALSSKFHLIAALPLILIFVYKNFTKTKTVLFAFFPILIYLFFAFPYINSPGFQTFVLNNQEQLRIFQLFVKVGPLKIYMILIALSVVYIRFFAYKKINNDLLISYLGVLFSIFILFVYPAVAWYVWVIPFLSVFVINNVKKDFRLTYLYVFLSFAYLIFFLFLSKNNYMLSDLNLLSKHLNIKFSETKLSSIAFTALQTLLGITVYVLYKIGVQSNAIYKNNKLTIIGIAGNSGAGKTILLSDISNLISDQAQVALEGDAYHKWERDSEMWQQFSHLSPKANFIYKQAEDLFQLKNGFPIKTVSYNHENGTFTPDKTITCNDFILIAGLHPFYLPKARKAIDMKIFMNTDDILRKHWKIKRDVRERGYSTEHVLKQIKKRNEDAGRYVEPQKKFADLVISYKSKESFGSTEIKKEPQLEVKIEFDSNIDIEPLINYLQIKGLNIKHDYSTDLFTQFIIADDNVTREIIKKGADLIIENIDELTQKQDRKWQNGCRGFVQLIVLIVLSEIIKNKS